MADHTPQPVTDTEQPKPAKGYLGDVPITGPFPPFCRDAHSMRCDWNPKGHEELFAPPSETGD